MAGSGDLMFRAGITFDKEGAIVSDMSKILKNLQLFADGKPIVEKINFDTSGFDAFEKFYKRSSAQITELRKYLENTFNNIPSKLKFADGTGSNLTADAERLLSVINQLRVAEQTYAKTASNILKEREKAIEAEMKADEKAYQKWLQQKEKEVQDRQKAEDRKAQATQNAITRQNAEIRAQEEKRYQDYLNEKQREVEAERQASAKKLAEQKRYDAAVRQANHKRAMEAYQLAQTLRAQEDVIGNLTAKLAIYQKQISQQQVGTDVWNKTALEIRRITEELERSTQKMRDFQQAAFKGLSDTWVTHQVQQLTQWRAELDNIDKRIHEIQQARVNMGRPQYKEDEMNRLLDQRIAKTKQMNNMLTSAADLQLKREKEITAEKQRQEKIAAGNKAAAQRLREENAILRQRENTINRITAKLQIQQQRLNSAEFGSRAFNGIVREVERLTKKLQEAQNKINELTGKTTTSANTQANSLKKVTNEYGRQEQYLRNLTTRLAAYASIRALGGFLASVREVTAQFELQRVSLGAIIQDQNRANQLFSEIKSFALKSPVKILDLTKYVKQVAAYRIETDKLFDTTKRLADVSVGLGVDMQRIVLAYGQVKAASYLRAAEIRQFTEAGIPLLELLAEKFTKLNGEMVTTEQVMDKVSKRGVSFQMVEEIFKDMTDAGGIFYNMQEKQGNTLFGMWAKLGDAASVMYDKIGNTESVNNAMKSTINLLTDLMRNWKATFTAMATIGSAAIGGMLIKKVRSIGENVLNKQVTIASNEVVKAQTQLSLAYQSNDKAAIKNAEATLKNAKAKEQNAIATRNAANANQKFATGWKAFSSSLLTGLGWGAVIAGVTALIYELKKAWDAAHAVANEINKIRSETPNLQMQGVDNFIRLADAAISSADGSKEQTEALNELHRTYKDMLPLESMSIENLRKLKAGSEDASEAYKTLTSSIEQYVAMQQKQREVDFINEHYGTIQIDMQRKLREALRADSFMSEDEIARLWKAFAKTSQDASKGVREQFVQAMKDAGLQSGERFGENFEKALEKALDVKSDWWSGLMYNPLNTLFGGGSVDDQILLASALNKLSESYRGQTEELKATDEAYKELTGTVGVYKTAMEALFNLLSEKASMMPESFKDQQENINEQIHGMITFIERELKRLGVEIPDWFDWHALLPENGLWDQSTIDFDKLLDILHKFGYEDLAKVVEGIQAKYKQLVPSDQTIITFRHRFNELALQMKANMDEVGKYWWQSGEDVKTHREKIKDEIEKLRILLLTYAKEKALAMAFGNEDRVMELDELIKDIENTQAFFKKYLEELPNTDKPKKTRGGSKSDDRLTLLNEIEQALTTINSKYDEMLKKEGKTQALRDINEIYANQLKYINDIAKTVKGVKLPTFEMPTDYMDLRNYRQEILKAIETLKKSKVKGATKAALELEMKIGTEDWKKTEEIIENRLKELSERISRSKTAREFYDKILTQTGDVDLAASVTLSIYGDTGEGLFEQTIEQIREVFASGVEGVNIPIDTAFDMTNQVIDYGKLAKLYEQYQNQLIEANKSTALKIVQEGQKASAQQILTWDKELAKAKTTEEQITDIIEQETERRIEILKNPALKAEQKKERIGWSYDKQAQEIAKKRVDEFRNSEDFIRVFQDLDNVSKKTLERMKERLKAMIETVQGTENVEGLKALIDALEKIEDQQEKRAPFMTAIKGFKELIEARKAYRAAQENEMQVRRENEMKMIEFEQERTQAMIEQEGAQRYVNELEAKGMQNTSQWIQASQKLQKAQEKVQKIDQKIEKSNKEVADAAQQTTDALDASKKAGNKVMKSVQAMADGFNTAAGAIQEIADLLGIAEDSDMDYIVQDIVTGLQTAAMIMGLILTISTAVSSTMWWVALIGAAVAALTALGSWLANAKVRAANKEIERQEKILHGLERAYDQLAKAQEKVFGSDYIRNFNQRLENLKVQAAAYYKQLLAEQSKGKKKSEDSIQDYMDSYRDTLQEIKDMASELSDYFLGSDITSAAREWANAWLDARWAFEDTTEAMREKFADMVQNMIVESMAARIMEVALQPVWDAVDELSADGTLDAEDIAKIAQLGVKAMNDAGNAMEDLLASFQAAGLDLSQWFGEEAGELTGISRDIATASEESINGLAQGINTQNFYMMTINENVMAIRAIMEGGATVGGNGGLDLISLQNEHLSQLPMIEANTRLTAERAERAALACEEIASVLGRVVVGRGNRFVLRTEL